MQKVIEDHSAYGIRRIKDALLEEHKTHIQTVLKLASEFLDGLFNIAIKTIPAKLICHQDQGSQYTSYEYVDLVLKNKIILSYSTPGTPTDNPGQESFFGRLKDESQAEFNETKNFKQLKKLMQNKMNYYNKKRLHTSLKNQSPKKFTINFIKNLSLF